METTSQNIGELAAALAQAQTELEPAVKNSVNPALRNRYADLASVCSAAMKVLPKHGLAVSQICVPAEAGRICVRTLLMHTSGQWIASDCSLPSDAANRGVNAAQAAGSAITYARRYGLSAIIGLATDDDDGCEAGQAQPTQPAQRQARREPPKTVSPQTDALRRAMFDELRARGFQSPESMKSELSNFFGRSVTATAELSAEEIEDYLSACRADKEGANA